MWTFGLRRPLSHDCGRRRNVEDASKVVSVDAVHASDRMLFRVSEWGGIEVKCVV